MMIVPVAFPVFIMATINFVVGCFHLLLFLKRRKQSGLLPFALLCFSVCLYDLFCIGLYGANNIDEGIMWQKLQLGTVDLISIFLIWFVMVFTGQQKNRLAMFFIIWFGLLLVLSVLLGSEFTLSASRPAIKHIAFLGLSNITYYEGEVGVLYLLIIATAIISYAYMLRLLFGYFKKTRDRNVIAIIFGQCFYFLTIINDSSVASLLYPGIYLSEYGFMVIVLAMSYVLLNEFVGLYSAVEEANLHLESKVVERTREIQKLNDDLKRLADLDGLTGIYNRRFFNNYLEIEVRRAQNQLDHKKMQSDTGADMNFGLAILDIDHFKLINDRFGHPVGDRVLVEVVGEIKKAIFSRDLFCRYGGEEFVILFTRTSPEGIVRAIEKIRSSVEQHPFDVGQSTPYTVTISGGVAIFGELSNRNSADLLKIADDRLLQAKAQGRNKIVVG